MVIENRAQTKSEYLVLLKGKELKHYKIIPEIEDVFRENFLVYLLYFEQPSLTLLMPSHRNVKEIEGETFDELIEKYRETWKDESEGNARNIVSRSLDFLLDSSMFKARWVPSRTHEGLWQSEFFNRSEIVEYFLPIKDKISKTSEDKDYIEAREFVFKRLYFQE